MTGTPANRALESIWRIESPKLIARLTRIVRDVGLAEEIAQDALVTALEQRPQDGVPRNPGAWLTATAEHRAVDLVRREVRLGQKIVELGRDLEVRQEMDVRNWRTAPPRGSNC